MDPHREEGGSQREEESGEAHSDHLVSWVRVETPADDLQGTLCGSEFSIKCGAELEVKEINLPGVHLPSGVQTNTLKHREKGPDIEVEVGGVYFLQGFPILMMLKNQGEEDEEIIISSSESDSSCSYGSSEEDIEEECEDMEDSDEDEGAYQITPGVIPPSIFYAFSFNNIAYR